MVPNAFILDSYASLISPLMDKPEILITTQIFHRSLETNERKKKALNQVKVIHDGKGAAQF